MNKVLYWLPLFHSPGHRFSSKHLHFPALENDGGGGPPPELISDQILCSCPPGSKEENKGHNLERKTLDYTNVLIKWRQQGPQDRFMHPRCTKLDLSPKVNRSSRRKWVPTLNTGDIRCFSVQQMLMLAAVTLEQFPFAGKVPFPVGLQWCKKCNRREFSGGSFC